MLAVVSVTLKLAPSCDETGGLPMLVTTRSGLPPPPPVVTVNVTPLLLDPATLTTTSPVVAPDGTGTPIDVALQLVGAPATPLNVTVLAPCDAPKSDPEIVTAVATGPELGDRFAIDGGIIDQR